MNDSAPIQCEREWETKADRGLCIAVGCEEPRCTVVVSPTSMETTQSLFCRKHRKALK